MTIIQLSLAITTVIILSIGQILFKNAADTIDVTSNGWVHGFILNPWLISGLVIYAGAVVLWLYVLKVLPLSIAYPFVALAFFLVPILSFFFLGETLKWSNFVGAALIMTGVWISSL